MVWALDTLVGDHNAKLVLIALADNADDEKFQCWPSVGYVAKRVELSPASVYRAIIHLTRKKLLTHEKRHRASSGWRMSPLFTLHVVTNSQPENRPILNSGAPILTAETIKEPSLNRHLKKEGNLDLKKESKGAVGDRTWIEVGSDQWKAWEAHWLKTRGVRPKRHNDAGWWFPSEWPEAKKGKAA
jgi:hypothetical protein